MGASSGKEVSPQEVKAERAGFQRLEQGRPFTEFFQGAYPQLADCLSTKVTQLLSKDPASFNGLDIYVASVNIQGLYSAGQVIKAKANVVDMCKKAFSDDASDELKLSIFRLLKPEHLECLYTSPEQDLYLAIINKTHKLLGQIAAKQPRFAASEVTSVHVGADNSSVQPDLSDVKSMLQGDILVSGIRNLDADRNNMISTDELSKFLSEKVPGMPKAHHNALMDMFDKDKDGTISVDELLRAVTGQDHTPGTRLAMVKVCVNDHTCREPATSTPFGHTMMVKYLSLKLMRMLGSNDFLLSSQYYGDDYTTETQFIEFLKAHDPTMLEGGFVGFAPATKSPDSIKYMEKYLQLCADCDVPNVFLDVNLVDCPGGTAPHMQGSLVDASKANAEFVLEAVHKIDRMFRRNGFPDNPWREVPAKAAPAGEVYVNFINVLDWLQLRPGAMPSGERAEQLGEMFKVLYSDKVFQRRVTAVVIEEGHGLSVPGDFKNVMTWMRNYFPFECKVPGEPNPEGVKGGYRVMLHCHASHTGHEHVSTLELIEAGGDGIWAGFIPDAAQFGHNNIFVFLENMLRFGNADVWRSWHLEQAIEVARHIYFLNFNTVTVPASYHIWGSAVRSEANTFFRTVADKGWRRRRANFYHNWSPEEMAELEKDLGQIALAQQSRRNEARDALNGAWVGNREDRWRKVVEGDYHVAPLMGNLPTIHRRLQELELPGVDLKKHSDTVPDSSPAHKVRQLGFAMMVADLRANFNDPGFLKQVTSWLQDPPTGPPGDSFQGHTSMDAVATNAVKRFDSGQFGLQFADAQGKLLPDSSSESEVSERSSIERHPFAPLYRMQQLRATGEEPLVKVRLVDKSKVLAMGVNWHDVKELVEQLAKLEHKHLEHCADLINPLGSPYSLLVLGPADTLSVRSLLDLHLPAPQSDVLRIGRDIVGVLEYLDSQNCRTFSIEFDNHDGHWGQHNWPPFVCEEFCPASLVVTALNEPAHVWNVDHPMQAIEVGQVIIGIDGVSGKSAAQLRTAFNKAKKLTMTLKSVSLLHSGITADNILISSDGQVRLSMPTFNHFVQFQGSNADGAPSLYWSPERAQAACYDGRDDVWATGCVMAELLSGKPLDVLASEAPQPARGRWDPLQSSEVFLLEKFKEVLQRSLTLSRRGRLQAKQLKEQIERVPSPTMLLGIQTFGVRGLLPAAGGSKYHYCKVSIPSMPDNTFNTESVLGSGNIKWDEREALATYNGEPIEFSIWSSSTCSDACEDQPSLTKDASLLNRIFGSKFRTGKADACLAKTELANLDITGAEQELVLGDAGDIVLTIRVVKPQGDSARQLPSNSDASSDFLEMVEQAITLRSKKPQKCWPLCG